MVLWGLQLIYNTLHKAPFLPFSRETGEAAEGPSGEWGLFPRFWDSGCCGCTEGAKRDTDCPIGDFGGPISAAGGPVGAVGGLSRAAEGKIVSE